MNKLSTFILIIAVITALASAGVIKRATSKITVTVESDQVFCSFLPRKPGQDIGSSEDDAISFCTQKSSKAPGAKIFPSGFIASSHFKAEGSFVQVTGRINRDAYKLSSSDGGGQYDSVGAPPGAQCAGFKKFVNLVEPDVEHFCIRCCHDPSDCDTGRSTDGCESIIPGDYS